jgi:putative phosphoribosyl transferase
LLTRDEESIDVHTSEYRFDIDRLARRVVLATDWAQGRKDLQSLPIGYFGASTGAAAALIAAAERPHFVQAVVSRGGRPDLADGWLPKVLAPTLLIVGGHDKPVIGMNRDAMRQMAATVELAIVPGATHHSRRREPSSKRCAWRWTGSVATFSERRICHVHAKCTARPMA